MGTLSKDEINTDLFDECKRLKVELDEVSKRYTAMVIQNQAIAADNERLTEELIRACAELSGIKKQEHVGSAMDEVADFGPHYVNFLKRVEFGQKLYAKPVYQHSFTLSGIGTFYADSELEITHLERLHGVGGKANLKEVTDER